MTAGQDLGAVEPCCVFWMQIAMALHGAVISRSMCPSAPAHSPREAPDWCGSLAPCCQL